MGQKALLLFKMKGKTPKSQSKLALVMQWEKPVSSGKPGLWQWFGNGTAELSSGASSNTAAGSEGSSALLKGQRKRPLLLCQMRELGLCSYSGHCNSPVTSINEIQNLSLPTQ